MQVTHWGREKQFIRRHPNAAAPLQNWREGVQQAEWRNFADVRQTFTTADWVDGKIVFDIKGNDYRLIAIVKFSKCRVYIRQVLTHEEYNKSYWKT